MNKSISMDSQMWVFNHQQILVECTRVSGFILGTQLVMANKTVPALLELRVRARDTHARCYI